MTNLEGVRRTTRRRRGRDGEEEEEEEEEDRSPWKPVDRTQLRAYVGLLILAGVYRSRGEACESLWDPESGRAVFRATMPLKTFRSYSSVLRFDDRETREARRAASSSSSSYGDKLAPVRKLWDAWCQRLPLLYDPGPEVTVDERLVPFKGSKEEKKRKESIN
ncbi:hypothetical protein NQD34_003950 [Periophthalmus magnuspinnatus]|nr:hypothetical protein NQD34_003950 [Periophthalmus magnuspinnatus]